MSVSYGKFALPTSQHCQPGRYRATGARGLPALWLPLRKEHSLTLLE